MKYKSPILLLILVFFNSSLASTQTGFPANIPNSELIRSSSTTVTDITGDSMPEIIVGDSEGMVYVYNNDGSELWRYNTGAAAIESKVAVADLNLNGNKEIIISSGSTFTPGTEGKITVLTNTGGLVCTHTPPSFGGTIGVYATVAVANLDNSDPELEFTFGDWGAKISVLNHDCSVVWQSQSPPGVTGVQLPVDFDETIPPYHVYVNDTIWSSAAIADMNNDGQLDIIIGVDTHIDGNNITIDGGRIIVINGHNGTVQLAIDTDEVIWSSPSIADINNDGSLDIVAGTGYCWQNPACAPPPNGTHAIVNRIYAWDANGQLISGWPHNLGNYTVMNSSPAIADLDKNGTLEVIINAFKLGTNDGKLFIINSNGSLKWSAIPNVPTGAAPPNDFVHFAASASSPIVADIDNDEELDVILPSNWDILAWDKNGNQVTTTSGLPRFHASYTVGSTPSIVDLDGDGDIELVVGGSHAAENPLPASIHVWDLDTPTSTFVPWSSFRNGERNTGQYLSDIIYADGFE